MVQRYLASLKENTGMSWADISAASRIPETTLRQIFSGETKSPGFDTVMQVVIAMGGNLNDLVAGVDPKTVINPVEVISKARQEHNNEGCRGTHGECHIVSSIASAYESRIADLKESFTEQSMHYRQMNDSRIEEMKRDKKTLAIAVGGMMAFLFLMIIIDICIGTSGWIQY